MKSNGLWPRTLQILAGLATSSGVALSLGGYAMASESQVVDLAPVTNVSETNMVPEGSVELVSTESSSTMLPAESKTVVSSDVPKVAEQKTSSKPDVAPKEADKAAQHEVKSAESTTIKAPETPVTEVVKEVSSTPMVEVQMPQVAVAGMPPNTTPEPASQTGSQTGPAAAPIVNEQLPPASYRVVSLPMQPVITSRPEAVVDLATEVPSALTHVPEPVPAPATGLLTRFTAELANVAMPLVLFLSALFTATVPVQSFLPLILLASVVVLTFGLWLRRAGFAHAARSDMAAFTFATPVGLGHADVFTSMQGPFFVGVRNVIPMFVTININDERRGM